MSRVSTMFQTQPPSASAPTTNTQGYPAFTRPIEERFLQALLTNTLGQTFYASVRELLAEAEAVHAEMIAKDPAFAARAISFARNRGFMRTQPIFALSMLAKSEGTHFERAFMEIIRTPTDLADFTTIMKSKRNGEGGRRVKRVAGKWLVENLSEYWAIKYGADKDGGYSLRDLLQVYHPQAGRRLPLFDYIMGRFKFETRQEGEKVHLDVHGEGMFDLEKVAAHEALKHAQTDAQKIAAITRGRLPHEVVTPHASSPAVWEALVPQMPIFALVKNLATIERHGIMDKVRDHVVGLLSNAEAVKKSKILPFRFVEAEKHVSDARVKDALRDAVELSFENVPDVPGRTAVMLDISGSMGDSATGSGGPSRLDVGALFAVTLMKKAGGNGKMFLFDTRLMNFAVSMRDSVLTQARNIRPAGGTDTSLPVEYIRANKEKYDNIILITDEQQNAGTPFIDVLSRYRREVNAKVKTFILDVAPYQGSLAPSDPLTWYLYGFSDQALSFISMAAKGWGGVVEEINRTPEA